MENKEEKNTGLDLDTTLIETKSKVETLYSNYKKQINMGILIALLAVAGYYGFTKFYLEP